METSAVSAIFGGEPIEVLAPEKILDRGLRDTDLRLKMEELSSRSAVARPLFENLSLYLTESIPSKGNPGSTLLEDCCRQAVQSATMNRRASDREIAMALIKGAIYHIPSVLGFIVEQADRDERCRWDPFSEPLASWRSRVVLYPSARAREQSSDASHIGVGAPDFRFVVLVRFLDRDAFALREFAPELPALTLRNL